MPSRTTTPQPSKTKIATSTCSRTTSRVRRRAAGLVVVTSGIVEPVRRLATCSPAGIAGAGPGTFKKKKAARRATRQQLAAGRGPKSLQILLDEVSVRRSACPCAASGKQFLAAAPRSLLSAMCFPYSYSPGPLTGCTAEHGHLSDGGDGPASNLLRPQVLLRLRLHSKVRSAALRRFLGDLWHAGG